VVTPNDERAHHHEVVPKLFVDHAEALRAHVGECVRCGCVIFVYAYVHERVFSVCMCT
jgi:hypothetical protein